ncbi:hypothetical protein PR048_014219 [Dryococelus australis]|uniref:Uncharacterized protein n=1 Tax=Dryococelus australis TaxID=614101 RepID=A0ABQ9HE03_9NEOP|nr:hypothetical protein PR048_014219 [Dryococelus australis]
MSHAHYQLRVHGEVIDRAVCSWRLEGEEFMVAGRGGVHGGWKGRSGGGRITPPQRYLLQSPCACGKCLSFTTCVDMCQQLHFPSTTQGSPIKLFMVTDNVSNLCAAISGSQWTWIHTLQLAIDSKSAAVKALSLISKAYMFVGCYNHIVAELTASSLDSVCLTSVEWKLIGGIVHVLRPFVEATKESNGNSYPTTPMVILMIHCLEASTSTQIKINENSGSQYKLDTVNVLSTVMDPRYKLAVFSENGKIHFANLLKSEISVLCNENEVNTRNDNIQTRKINSGYLEQENAKNMQPVRMVGEEPTQLSNDGCCCKALGGNTSNTGNKEYFQRQETVTSQGAVHARSQGAVHARSQGAVHARSQGAVHARSQGAVHVRSQGAVHARSQGAVHARSSCILLGLATLSGRVRQRLGSEREECASKRGQKRAMGGPAFGSVLHPGLALLGLPGYIASPGRQKRFKQGSHMRNISSFIFITPLLPHYLICSSGWLEQIRVPQAEQPAPLRASLLSSIVTLPEGRSMLTWKIEFLRLSEDCSGLMTEFLSVTLGAGVGRKSATASIAQWRVRLVDWTIGLDAWVKDFTNYCNRQTEHVIFKPRAPSFYCSPAPLQDGVPSMPFTEEHSVQICRVRRTAVIFKHCAAVRVASIPAGRHCLSNHTRVRYVIAFMPSATEIRIQEPMCMRSDATPSRQGQG